jgi:sulfatase modifying factor 1
MRSDAHSSWLPLLGAVLSLALAQSATAVTMEWTVIGSPGNACDLQPDPWENGNPDCFGAVGYDYSIGTYEVTNAQYAEFLNAKTASDPLGLYNTSMGSGVGGITRSGVDGSYTYSTIVGRENMPVNNVSFYDALRFANWLNNGQGSASTESGAYTLLGGTATPSNGATVTRNAGATIVLTSEDEWYKAAYHDALNTCVGDYCSWPARFDSITTCAAPTATANRANCNNAVGNLTIKGSYTGSASPYGTFDQGGNVYEWNEASGVEAIIAGIRGFRGGSFLSSAINLAVTGWNGNVPAYENFTLGFRVAMIPEPSTGLLVIAGLLGLTARRRVHG